MNSSSIVGIIEISIPPGCHRASDVVRKVGSEMNKIINLNAYTIKRGPLVRKINSIQTRFTDRGNLKQGYILKYAVSYGIPIAG